MKNIIKQVQKANGAVSDRVLEHFSALVLDQRNFEGLG
jgi:hypothetical protein